MKSATRANTRTAFRSPATWILMLLVVANIAVWTAWPLRDELVALGILASPPVERVDLHPQALPPIADRPVPSSDSDRPLETRPGGEPASGEIESSEPIVAPDEGAPGVPEVAGQASAAGQPSPSRLLDCVIVGPVESRAALEAAATRLRSTGARLDSPSEASGVPALDYHVYVEPFPSRDAAPAVRAQLKAQFIKDAEITPRGPYRNTVAVGVYRNRNLADARRDRIAALGYAVKVRERHRLRARDVSTDALGDLAYWPCPDDEAG